LQGQMGQFSPNSGIKAKLTVKSYDLIKIPIGTVIAIHEIVRFSSTINSEGKIMITKSKFKRALSCLITSSAMALIILSCGQAFGAGVLTPVDSGHESIKIRSHQVNVTINNGFAITEVIQTFYNPNDVDLEAVYSFPLPKSASLSELTCLIGEEEIHGEVLAKNEAEKIYQEEKDKGGNAAIGKKDEFYRFEFSVTPVRSLSEVGIRFLYYQPLKIEGGVGRYLYPLQEGGTDEAATNFWSVNEKVEEHFTINLELRSAWPVTKVRTPGFEGESLITRLGDGHFTAKIERMKTELNKDFLFYYRLDENLPGRVELIPYRKDATKPGSFMMIITPGVDLKPLTRGADYIFVLDVSGSMDSKIRTLADGVSRALGQMTGMDRFRIITFNDKARELTNNWEDATPENVQAYIEKVKALSSGGSTDIYKGISRALRNLDNDRATSIVLVTDAVTNTGIVDPKEFHDLMKKYDVRIFGFVMGNSGNWPLMRVICEATGGFSAGVSNDDDIIGQIQQAKEKIVFECMHDVDLKIRGVKTFETTGDEVGKVYQGEQMVVFGRYDQAGQAKITLKCAMTGEDKTYTTEFDFPEIATEYPEVDRLFALSRIEYLEYQADIGKLPVKESESAVRDLGVKYQLVTDETYMVALSDAAFSSRGVERKNRARIQEERTARVQRKAIPAKKNRVDNNKPMFKKKSYSTGGGFKGGGALDPKAAGVALVLSVLAMTIFLKPRKNGKKS